MFSGLVDADYYTPKLEIKPQLDKNGKTISRLLLYTKIRNQTTTGPSGLTTIVLLLYTKIRNQTTTDDDDDFILP